MKRKHYRIIVNGYFEGVKHTWNAARRAVPGLIAKNHLAVGQTAELTDKAFRKDADGFVCGHEHWTDNAGKKHMVWIERYQQ